MREGERSRGGERGGAGTPFSFVSPKTKPTTLFPFQKNKKKNIPSHLFSLSLCFRFDRFNLKYNPFGQSRLREVFIKQDNLIRGRFLAELTKEVFADLEASKYQHAEYRVSVYGRKRVEWATLAAWVAQHGLYSDNVVWLIQVRGGGGGGERRGRERTFGGGRAKQNKKHFPPITPPPPPPPPPSTSTHTKKKIPRLYDVYKAQGIVDSFAALIDNIFGPLFEATLDPGAHPQLHLFLKHVVGFDMVDDESKPERRPAKHMPSPEQWDLKHNPAYAYYAYYVHANLYTLNKLREVKKKGGGGGE